jgi:hypothetical protein
MNRLSIALGIPTGVIMAGSGAAHVMVGWPQLRASLARAQTPPDIVTGVAVAWHFGGVAMLTFGCLVVLLFVLAAKQRPVSAVPGWVIAFAYVAFGVGALLITRNPFFLIFVAPGLTLAAALW